MALQQVAGYAPLNGSYQLADLNAAFNELCDLQRAEADAAERAVAARKLAVAGEWQFHELVLGAKDQVVAQFGRDSDEAQSVGRKKKSDYKVRERKGSTK
jgi:hypothetical protein